MKALTRRQAVVMLLTGALSTVPGRSRAESGLEVMRRQRERLRTRDEQGVVRLHIFSRTGEVKERRLATYVLTGPDNFSKTLLRFLAPADVAGTGLLTWEQRDGDDDQWLYLPALGRVKRIAASGKKNRFMGTDFTYEDLRPESLPLHAYAVVGADRLDGSECIVIDATPATTRQAADSAYGRRRLWIRRDTYLTVKQEFYDKQGRLGKVSLGRKLVNVVGTVWRADEIEMKDVQAGTRTLLVTESRELNRGLTRDFFTEAELSRGSFD